MGQNQWESTAAGWLREADNLVWGPGMLMLLLGTGIYLTVRMDFLPLRNLKFALRCALGIGKKAGRMPSGCGKAGLAGRRGAGISPFSALTTELAATIGTGNIVGVATAMVLGGPGALIWMMASGLVGMATKLAESMLSVKYRCQNARQEFVGGPMYTMARAFPNRKAGRLLGCVFCVFAVLASFGMGNMTQSNSIADALKITFGVPVYQTGLAVSVVTILVVLGGIGSISRVTRVMVPFMGIFYLLGTLAVILTHLHNVPFGIFQMVKMAFSPRAVCGGIGGQICAGAAGALRWGVSRGVFSNEAGLGAAGISAAAADTTDYVEQGYISMTGVFFDTLVICSLTGLAIAASGVLGTVDEKGGLLTGTALCAAVFRTTFGEYGAVFISVCIALFAFATIVGWAYQGEKAFEFLAGSKYCLHYRFCYGLAAFAGAVLSLQTVWDFSDLCNGLMAVPNLLCVLLLSGEACREIQEYNG